MNEPEEIRKTGRIIKRLTATFFVVMAIALSFQLVLIKEIGCNGKDTGTPQNVIVR